MVAFNNKKRKAKRVPLRKKYSKSTGVKALAKRVSNLVRQFKPEKKTYLLNSPPGAGGAYPLGQLNGTSSGGGYLGFDISCSPGQGTLGSSRNGNEIQMTSAYYQFQFIQQSACTSPVKVKMYWFSVQGYPQSNPTGVVTALFNPNPFTNQTIYDAHSSLDSNYLGNFKLIKTKTVIVGADNYSGLTQIKTVNVGLKLKKPITVRFTGDGSNIQTEGWVYLVIMADNGNCSTSVVGTASNVANTAINTGLLMNYNFITYFTDV